MTKEEKAKAIEEATAQATTALTNVKNDKFMKESARDMPLLKGQTYTLTLKTGSQTSGIKWAWVECKDGSVISWTHLLRKHNGLNITGNTNEERLKSFYALYNDNGELDIKVADVKQKATLYNGEAGLSNYPIFEQI